MRGRIAAAIAALAIAGCDNPAPAPAVAPQPAPPPPRDEVAELRTRLAKQLDTCLPALLGGGELELSVAADGSIADDSTLRFDVPPAHSIETARAAGNTDEITTIEINRCTDLGGAHLPPGHAGPLVVRFR